MENEFVDSPSQKSGERQLRPWVIVVGAVLLCGLSFFLGKTLHSPSPELDRQDVVSSLGEFLPIAAIPRKMERTNSAIRVDDWCNYEKSFCSSIITNKPTDTLNALTASIPHGNAQSYRIRISMTPLDCDDSSSLGFGPPCSLEPPSTVETINPNIKEN